MADCEIKKTGSVEEDQYRYDTYAVLVGGRDIGGAQVMTSDTGAYVERIDIDEDERGHGYGTALLRWMSSEYGEIVIAADNERAAGLYARLGYEVDTFSDDYMYDQGFGVYRI